MVFPAPPRYKVAGFLTALLLHALVIGLIVNHTRSKPQIVKVPSAAIMIDLASFPAPAKVLPKSRQAHKQPAPMPVHVAQSLGQSVTQSDPSNSAATDSPETPVAKADPLAVLVAELRKRIQEKLVYPEAARRRNAWGSVNLEVLITPGGQLVNLRILHGSGSAILDKAALKLMASVIPLPMPDGLLGNTAIQLKVDYTPPN